MFLGHFGLAFGGKKAAPTLSLGLLFLAVGWADLLFFPLTLLGIEHFRIAPGATAVTPMDFLRLSDQPRAGGTRGRGARPRIRVLPFP